MRLIRSMHRYAFRSGQWGRIDGTVSMGGRACYRIRWNEGTYRDDHAETDFWPVEDDAAQYEFAEVLVDAGVLQ